MTAEPFDRDLRGDDDDVEEVDAVPVVASAAPATERASGGVAVRQAAAVAATSFAAGLATVAVGHALRARRERRRRPLPGIVASRQFLVEVHVLAPRD